jgi:2-C-methyl-D-erythritol 2,4-cyclodiphosphate synthase
MDLIADKGARLVNVDATVICQSPRLAAYLPEMAKQLSATLGVDVDRVSVKAKSPEHLGLLGREEGIAALAVVTVEVDSS